MSIGNLYKMFFDQTSTPTKGMRQKFIEHGNLLYAKQPTPDQNSDRG